MSAAELTEAITENWQVWLVTVTLVVAAVIDGIKLKVPNWITFPMILSGWVYSGIAFGWEGLLWSVLGTVRRPGAAAAGLRHRRHGCRRRQTAGRRRRLGWQHDDFLCILRVRHRRRSDRRGHGALSPGLGAPPRPILDDRQRSHHHSRCRQAVGHRRRSARVRCCCSPMAFPLPWARLPILPGPEC